MTTGRGSWKPGSRSSCSSPRSTACGSASRTARCSFTQDEWPGGKNLADSPAIWRRMFADIPSPNFGLNYDPSHLVWQQMDYLKPLREFADRDLPRPRQGCADRPATGSTTSAFWPRRCSTTRRSCPGLGDVDWGTFFSVLGDVGYRGPVCVEVEDRAYEGSLDAPRQAALRKCRRGSSSRQSRQFSRS